MRDTFNRIPHRELRKWMPTETKVDVVKQLNVEQGGKFEVSSAEKLLEQLR